MHSDNESKHVSDERQHDAGGLLGIKDSNLSLPPLAMPWEEASADTASKTSAMKLPAKANSTAAISSSFGRFVLPFHDSPASKMKIIIDPAPKGEHVQNLPPRMQDLGLLSPPPIPRNSRAKKSTRKAEAKVSRK